MAQVIADPKAVAARRMTANPATNTAATREAQLQAKKKAVQLAKGQAWRKAHGLS